MNRSWFTAPFGDVVTLAQGLCFNAKTNHLMAERGIPLLRIADLKKNTETKFVDADRVPKKYIANPNDIIYTRTGQVGLVFKGKTGVVHNNCFRVIPKEGINPDYVYWFLRQPSIIRQARSLAGGAAQPDLSHGAFKSILFKYPEIGAQNSIVDVLATYDDLIKNNTRRIEILEEMARRLYEEWFVHFRFPGHEGVSFKESELGMIPEGWEVVNLEEMVDLTMGQSPKSEFYNDTREGLPFHQGVTDFGNYFPSNRLYCTVESRIAEEGDILFSVRAPVGRINISKEKIVIGRGVSALRSKAGHQIFLLSQLRKIFEEEDSIGNGAIFKAVTKKDMQTIKLLKPNAHYIDGFESIAGSLWKQIRVLSDKNINIRAQRDLLLPKLVSGEIDVSATTMPDDKEVEAA